MTEKSADQISTKTCKSCKVNLPLDAFIKADGPNRSTRNRCKECCKLHAKVRTTLKAQNPVPEAGNCPICDSYTEKWVLDHCHETLTFRGYICRDCNAGIGLLKDNADILKNALYYLNTVQ